MSKPMETRLYPMADAGLKQVADNLKNSITRDATEFATRNVGEPQITAYAALIDSFDNTTTDVELQGMVSMAVAEKDAVAESIKKAIRPIRNMAEVAYGTKGKYKVFGFEDMARLSDDDLYRMARRVVRVGTTVQADLTLQGLGPTQLSDLATLAVNLDAAIDKVGAATEQRDMETQNRVMKGNQLYKETMRLASIGQSLFADTDEARYNDYIMIDNSTPGGSIITPPPNTN
jgi:hypothetical protein